MSLATRESARGTARRAATWLTGLALLLATAAVLGQALQPLPTVTEHVTDLTRTLSASQRTALEQKLAAFEARKGSQVIVVIVPTTSPEEIEQYSIRLADKVKAGRRNVDDGAILLIAKDDHRMRIEVGRGLEGALTDADCNRIIDEILTPRFRQGDFYGAIDTALDRMLGVIEGEALPPPDQRWTPAHRLPPSLPLLLIAAVVLASVLRNVFGRTAGSILAGGGVGFLAWLMSGVLALGVVAGIIAFVLAILSGTGGSRWSSGGGWGGFGGMGGFGGGGFGGGGGFSGGGGGFAGGGASGRW